MDKTSLKCWIITEGMIGTENQCLGVTDALGIKPTVKKIQLRQPWKSLTPWLKWEQSCSFYEPLTPPWPDLLITSGRKAVAASHYIKKQNKETFTLHIQDPKCNPSDFDLVAVPHHDGLRGDNVIVTHGAPNRINRDLLNAAKEKFSAQFEDTPSPKIAVLIGGNSRAHSMTKQVMQNLVAQLNQIDGFLMITASRRTGEENLRYLQQNLRQENAYLWNGTGDNPYHAMLGYADHIIVTEDSVSMISDAGTTGKPVRIIPLDGSSKRFDKFHAHMRNLGVTRPFTGNLESWSYEPLHDSQMVAQALTQAMQKMYG